MTVKISLSATDFPVKSVKIFSCGEAEVTRTFPLDLTNCPNESLVIDISKLPSMLDALRPPSVTTGSADLLILDYYSSTSRPGCWFGTGSLSDLNSDVLRDLNAKYTSLEDERQLRQKSFTFLSTYMDSLAQGKVLANETGPAQLVTFFDEFVELGKSRSEIIAVLDQQINDVQHEIREEMGRLQQECFSSTTTATVVLAPVPGDTVNAELELVYRVKATWKPVYEVHVTTIDGVASSSVVLNYRCQISQCTGEDWDDVELVVTTAKPDVPLAGLPEPKKMALVEVFSQSFPRLDVRTTPFWNIPGQASAFSSILSVPQPTASTGRPSLFGSTQDREPANQGLSGSSPAQSQPSLFGTLQPPAQSRPNLFATPQPPAQSYPNLFSTLQPPAQSYPNLFATPQPSAQSYPNLFATPQPPVQSYPNLFATPQPPAQSYPNLFATLQPSAQSYPNLFANLQPPAQRITTSSSNQPAPPPPYQDGKGTEPAELERDITHTATAKVFIPSSMDFHHVLIATIPLKASFVRVAVPAVDSRVFYTCEITNTSSYYMLPSSPVHTYLDRKHVSDSKITDLAKLQHIQCSLGIDSAVTTEVERRTQVNSDAVHILSMDERKTHTITITVKSTHEGPIGDIIVRASLPVPQSHRITVALREPKGLDSGTVTVRDKCFARWSTTGDRTGKYGGVVEWVCHDMQPGSQVLTAAWDVSAPPGCSVREQ